MESVKKGGYRQAHPMHACTAIAISRDGAIGLSAVWEHHLAKYHFDVSLIRALMSDEIVRNAVRSCFVYPSVGHYGTHHSSILQEVRESSWDLPCVQEGTRPFASHHNHRTLHDFCKKGLPRDLPSPIA